MIRNEYSHGTHLAILYGIETVARSDIVVTLDADGQHFPEDIQRMLQPIFEGKADFTLGRRNRLPPSEKIVRIVFRKILNDSNGGWMRAAGSRPSYEGMYSGLIQKETCGIAATPPCSCTR